MPKRDDLFVDTSGWSCYLNSDEQFHPIITAFIANALKNQQRLITTNYVITELVALLSSRYPLPRSQVITWINEIKRDIRVEIVHIDQVLDNASWTLLERRLDKKWSLVDASSFVVMKHFTMSQVLTTDHHFAQAGFEQVPESTRRYQ